MFLDSNQKYLKNFNRVPRLRANFYIKLYSNNFRTSLNYNFVNLIKTALGKYAVFDLLTYQTLLYKF